MLFLDDATSTLDSEVEVAIQEMILKTLRCDIFSLRKPYR